MTVDGCDRYRISNRALVRRGSKKEISVAFPFTARGYRFIMSTSLYTWPMIIKGGTLETINFYSVLRSKDYSLFKGWCQTSPSGLRGAGPSIKNVKLCLTILIPTYLCHKLSQISDPPMHLELKYPNDCPALICSFELCKEGPIDLHLYCFVNIIKKLTNGLIKIESKA